MHLITLFKASLHLANGSYINNNKKKHPPSASSTSNVPSRSVVSQYAAFFVLKEKHHVSYTPLEIKDCGQTVLWYHREKAICEGDQGTPPIGVKLHKGFWLTRPRHCC